MAVLGGVWDQALSGGGLGLGVFLLLALFAGLVMGVASWIRTTYWIDERELRVDTGVLSRQSRRIRIDRLQGVDIHQPLVARLVRHAQLRFDVAGGEVEADLAFLPLAEAQEVRRMLLARRSQLRQQAAGPTAHGVPGHPGEAAQPDQEPDQERTLARLDLRLLALSTVLTLETVVFLVGAVALGAVALSSGSLATAGFLLPLLLGTGLALGRRVNANYGHVVSASEAGLVMRRGLLGVSHQTVALARVQGVRISEPLLWRRYGWARLEVSVAGASGGGEDSALSPVIMPVADRSTIRELARHALRGLDPEDVALLPAPRKARWRAPLSARWAAIGGTEDLVVSRRGVLTRRLDAAPTTRVQSLRLDRGPWSRALGLADVVVHSPVGRVQVMGRFRREDEARAILERLIGDTRAARHRALRPPAGSWCE